jgi:hypothetical protein
MIQQSGLSVREAMRKNVEPYQDLKIRTVTLDR